MVKPEIFFFDFYFRFWGFFSWTCTLDHPTATKQIQKLWLYKYNSIHIKRWANINTSNAPWNKSVQSCGDFYILVWHPGAIWTSLILLSPEKMMENWSQLIARAAWHWFPMQSMERRCWEPKFTTMYVIKYFQNVFSNVYWASTEEALLCLKERTGYEKRQAKQHDSLDKSGISGHTGSTGICMLSHAIKMKTPTPSIF